MITRRAAILVVSAALCTAGAILAGRPELAALAAGFAAPAAAGFALARRVELSATLRLPHDRAIEGDTVDVEAVVAVDRPTNATLEVVFEADRRTETHAQRPIAPPIGVRLDGRQLFRLPIDLSSWGDHRIRGLRVSLHDPFGMVERRGILGSDLRIRAHPPTSRLAALAAPNDVRMVSGSHPSRHLGPGNEFADVRTYRHGDPPRSVNWRATARRGSLWVNERHPERASDVVLFLDSFAAAGRGEDSTLRLAVRTAIRLAQRHVSVTDRIGLVDLGGMFRWLPLGTGVVQLHRVVDALLDSQLVASAADKPLGLLPRAAFPSRALVVALTPLLDDRAITALFELRGRNHDVVVLDASAEPRVEPGGSPWAGLAHRLWLLERDARRDELRAAGIAVGSLTDDEDLDTVLDALLRARRRTASVSR